MGRHTTSAAACMAAVLLFSISFARADYRGAMAAYRAGEYDTAHALFLELAEIGDGASQYNLGAMATQGQGMPQSGGVGVGWLLAAAQNGYVRTPTESLEAMRAALSADELKKAQDIIERYGLKALQERVLPGPRGPCFVDIQPRMMQLGTYGYPPTPVPTAGGFVYLLFTIGADGLVRDPEVSMTVPPDVFDVKAVKYLMTTRFEPARDAGQASKARYGITIDLNHTEGVPRWNMKALKKLKTESDSGSPSAQYVVGLARLFDSKLKISGDPSQLILSAAQGGHPAAQYWIGRKLMVEADCGDIRRSAPWLRQAAAAGDAGAQMTLALGLLHSTSSPVQLSEARALIVQAVASAENPRALKLAVGTLATSPVEALRDPPLALTGANLLAKTWGVHDPQTLETIAAAQAATGHFKEAVDRQEQAVRLARTLLWNVDPLNERLTAYQARQAWIGALFEVKPNVDLPPLDPSRATFAYCPADSPECWKLKKQRDAERKSRGSR